MGVMGVLVVIHPFQLTPQRTVVVLAIRAVPVLMKVEAVVVLPVPHHPERPESLQVHIGVVLPYPIILVVAGLLVVPRTPLAIMPNGVVLEALGQRLLRIIPMLAVLLYLAEVPGELVVVFLQLTLRMPVVMVAYMVPILLVAVLLVVL
ncbi:MAG: hypothetical protein CME31_01265 [Gimesia sp.]|nr:hypothetical protein [Gimesia sp.]